MQGILLLQSKCSQTTPSFALCQQIRKEQQDHLCSVRRLFGFGVGAFQIKPPLPVALLLPGLQNAMADQPSRQSSDIHKWSVKVGIPRNGPVCCRPEQQISVILIKGRFEPRLPDRHFSHPLVTRTKVCLALIPMIPRVMRKLKQFAGSMITKAPACFRQFWYSDLMNLTSYHFICLIQHSLTEQQADPTSGASFVTSDSLEADWIKSTERSSTAKVQNVLL